VPLNYVVVIGGANMDITAQASGHLGVGDSMPGRIHCAPGGVARNVAENLARLGHATHLVSVVGDDDFGRTLRRHTAHAGVDVAAFTVVPQQATAAYLSLHGPDGDMAMAINDMGIVAALTPDFLANYVDLLAAATCRVVDCNLSPDALACLSNASTASPLFVDGVSTVKC
jgi:pseudouridine kinase